MQYIYDKASDHLRTEDDSDLSLTLLPPAIAVRLAILTVTRSTSLPG